MEVKTICPICKQTLAVSVYSDRSVGIKFDYDILEEGTNCTCDVDVDAIAEKQFEALQKDFHYLV